MFFICKKLKCFFINYFITNCKNAIIKIATTTTTTTPQLRTFKMQIANDFDMKSISHKYYQMEIAPGLDMKSISHKYYQECRLPAEQCATVVHEDWSSIFIPCLPSGFDNDEKLRHLIEFVLKLGEIKRIDYSKHATTGKPMAFIHFAYWNDTYEVKKFRHYMENMEYMDLEGVHIFYTSSIAANIYNKGNTDKYVGLDHYFENIPKNMFVRMMINKTPIQETVLNIHQIAANADELNKKVIQLTETLESVVKENALLKEQMQYVMDRLLPKPKISRSFDCENPPSLSLDDLVTLDIESSLGDISEIVGVDDEEGECREHDEDYYNECNDELDSCSESSYPAFHPREFAEHYLEYMEEKMVLDTAIILKDYDTIANYFLKYEKCATDQPCVGCVFEEFCDDNNIGNNTIKSALVHVLTNMNKNLEHVHADADTGEVHEVQSNSSDNAVVDVSV